MNLFFHEYLVVGVFAVTFTGFGVMLARVWWGWR